MNADSETIVCDVHVHLIPVDEARLADHPGVVWDANARKMTIDGHAVSVPALFDPAKLLEWMDRSSVEHALISVPPPAYREHLDPSECRHWCAYLNDGLRDIAGRHPSRMTALTHLPIQNPALAADVAMNSVATGERCFSAPTGAPNIQIADAEFDALWRILSHAEAFLFMHPGSCADGRLESVYMSNLVGNPHESGVAIATLALGGVLDRFPGIQFCFAHGGGSAPMLAARLQRGYVTARPGMDTSFSSPSDLFPRLLVDCITHSEPAIALAESVFGRENIVFGSDWPFPMGIVSPGEQLASFDPGRRRRICRTTAARLRCTRIKIDQE